MSQHKGRSRDLARSVFWDEFERDEYVCPDCGRDIDEIRQDTFEVHHKDGDAYNNSIDNLVALCRLCHNLRENKKPSLNEIKTLRRQVKPNHTSEVYECFTEPERVFSLLYHHAEEYRIKKPRYGPSERGSSIIKIEQGDKLELPVKVAGVLDILDVIKKNGKYYLIDDEIQTDYKVNNALNEVSYDPNKDRGRVNVVKQLFNEIKPEIKVIEEFRTWEACVLGEMISTINHGVDTYESFDAVAEQKEQPSIFHYWSDWGNQHVLIKTKDYNDILSEYWGNKEIDDRRLCSHVRDRGIETSLEEIGVHTYRMISAEYDFVQYYLNAPDLVQPDNPIFKQPHI